MLSQATVEDEADDKDKQPHDQERGQVVLVAVDGDGGDFLDDFWLSHHLHLFDLIRAKLICDWLINSSRYYFILSWCPFGWFTWCVAFF